MKRHARSKTIGAVYPALARERMLLFATLDLFEDQELDFRPERPGSMLVPSPREIFQHIAESDRRLVEDGLAGQVFDATFLCDEGASTIIGRGLPDVDRAGVRNPPCQ